MPSCVEHVCAYNVKILNGFAVYDVRRTYMFCTTWQEGELHDWVDKTQLEWEYAQPQQTECIKKHTYQVLADWVDYRYLCFDEHEMLILKHADYIQLYLYSPFRFSMAPIQYKTAVW